MTMPDQFIAKWRKAELKERSAAQEHFIDLCRLLDHPTPAELDPTGESFCFEKGAAKHGGGEGFADVWKKGFFGWEYKGKHKDLNAAYDQLLRYRDALQNPPLLVVSDMERIVIHTNFTGTASVTHEIHLENFTEPRSLEILDALLKNPGKLRPGVTSEAITKDAAKRFAEIADAMRNRGLDPSQTAHFLDRVVFCLFAEDIGLLPEMIFTKTAENAAADPARFARLINSLFAAMAAGGDFGPIPIRHFNGSLFDDQTVLELTRDELGLIIEATKLDWSAINPSIFGTLFERGLDPAKRSQLGAHFTGAEDIELLVDAVVMRFLRREWDEVRHVVESLLATGQKRGIAEVRQAAGKTSVLPLKALKKAKGEAGLIIHRFLNRLQNVKILDASCGSGNFLYVCLFKLKDLEKEVIVFAIDNGLGSFLPMVGPWQLYGIEVNPYAFDLAQMTVWIGWLQWIRANGFGSPPDPVLRPMKGNFRLMDAILDLADPANSKVPEWPAVDFIIGNPPFLGGKLLRRELGDEYVEKLFAVYKDTVPAEADLCCYWFEQARRHIAAGKCKRVGLLATQGIRGGANREVLKRIKESGGIFWAIADKEWILDGANVHISLIAFDKGAEQEKILDGQSVSAINPNLTSHADLTSAKRLSANCCIAFMGDTKGGKFELTDPEALSLLEEPNPHGLPNSDVIVPWVNGLDVARRSRQMWIIDFGTEMDEACAALYASPFRLIKERVKPERDRNRRDTYRQFWWRHAEARPGMCSAIVKLPRHLLTVGVAKHRFFCWSQFPFLPDHALFIFARSDDYFFGVLQSRVHELWALAQGSQLREKASGFRYTPTSCFETFPFPPSLGLNPPSGGPEAKSIADAAKELYDLRERWLKPYDWTRMETLEFPATVGGPWDRFIDRAAYPPRTPSASVSIRDPMSPGEEKADPAAVRADTVNAQLSTRLEKGKIGLARYPRLLSKDAESAAKLEKRTLTSLYNERPDWLVNAHRKLDDAVLAAYGWSSSLSDAELLERLLELNRA